MDGLQEVPYQVFCEYLKNKNYKTVQGSIFHSTVYLDKNGKTIAYKETSSWGAPDIYKIKDNSGKYVNLNTLLFITNRFFK